MVDDLTGTDFVWHNVILPLGISFITFQKIAFLIDVAGGRIKSFTLRDYLPVRDVLPAADRRADHPLPRDDAAVPARHLPLRRDALAVGLTLFCFGLFKKVVLADGMALHVTPVFAYAASGAEATLLQSWLAAVGFTLQIYFDFSGYTDMALRRGAVLRRAAAAQLRLAAEGHAASSTSGCAGTSR